MAVLAVAAVFTAVAHFESRSESISPLLSFKSKSRPDIILVTIDTLRADAMGFAGNAKVETPFLDSIAAGGKVFTNAHAHNVVTLPSHANILTGLYPYEHGVRDNAGFKLDPRHQSIATRLRNAGYATGAFVGAFPLDGRFGLDQGFDVYDDDYAKGSNSLDFVIAERPAPEVLQAATRWFTSVRDRPRFLWVHLYDPHAPYEPRDDFARRYWDRKYLGEVAATDAALQQYLKPIVRPEDGHGPLLIVTADHGEALGEHGELTHGLFAYEETLKVPLIVFEHGAVAPGRDDRNVRHIDIVPTILERAGVKAAAELSGASLLAVAGNRDTYFEALSATLNRGWAPLAGMIHERHKYIDLPIPELYDLTADPGEARNQVRENRRTFFEIRRLMEAAAPAAKTADRNASEEDAAKLLSLGYITGSAAAKAEYTEGDDPKNLVDIDSMMHQVVHLYQLGQLERALGVAREIVKRRPGMAVGEEMLAFVLQQNAKTEDAIRTLRAAIARGNATVAMKRRLGLMLSETGQAAEAVAILRPLLAEAVDDLELLNAYGVALADDGDVPGAQAQFNRVLQIDQNNAAAYQNLGIVSLRQGDVQRASAYLDQALSINDRLPLALTTKGVIYARQGKFQDAIDSWSKAITLDDRQFDAMYNLGVVASKLGHRDEARNALEQFIRTAPPARYQRDIDAASRLLRSAG